MGWKIAGCYKKRTRNILSPLPDVWCVVVVVVVIAVVFVVVGTGVVVAKITIWRGYFLFP